MNDECADKIADNRFAIENSRDWLVNDGGIVDRMHRMSAKTVRYFLFSWMPNDFSWNEANTTNNYFDKAWALFEK